MNKIQSCINCGLYKDPQYNICRDCLNELDTCRTLLGEARELLKVWIDTVKKADKSDPDKAKRKILDAFAGLEIMPEDLEKYLEHNVSRIDEEWNQDKLFLFQEESHNLITKITKALKEK